MTHEELRAAIQAIVREELKGEYRAATEAEIRHVERRITHVLIDAYLETPETQTLVADPRRV